MVIMASGITRGRVRTTTMALPNMAAIIQKSTSLILPKVHFFDIMVIQVVIKVSADLYHETISRVQARLKHQTLHLPNLIHTLQIH